MEGLYQDEQWENKGHSRYRSSIFITVHVLEGGTIIWVCCWQQHKGSEKGGWDQLIHSTHGHSVLHFALEQWGSIKGF